MERLSVLLLGDQEGEVLTSAREVEFDNVSPVFPCKGNYTYVVY